MGSLENYNKFLSNFWDDNVNSTNGFDCMVEHVNRTFDIVTSTIDLIQTRLAIEHTYTKSLKKSAQIVMKNDKDGKLESVVRAIAQSMLSESETRAKFVKEATKNIIEPLKECFKKCFDLMKKLKSDCSVMIKNRKSQMENAIKACKNYTSKFRSHEALIKKHGEDVDEKMKMKIQKNSQVVKLAEKDAKVSIEMLNQALIDWEAKYIYFCKNAEHIDVTLITEVRCTLETYNRQSQSILNDCSVILTELANLPPEFTVDSYINNFVEEKGNNNVFMKFAYMIESGEGEKREIKFTFSTKQENPKLNMPFNPSGEPQISHPSSYYHDTNMNDRPSQSESTPPLPPPKSTQSSQYSAGSTVIALYDYKAQNEDELSFNIGSEICIVSQEDEAWYIGKLKSGKVGVFPISYAKPK